MSGSSFTDAPARFGQVFRCPICGAEVTVIRAGHGGPTPRCCNRYMMLKREHAAGYRCLLCGSEVVVIRQGDGELRPRCCNRDMIRR